MHDTREDLEFISFSGKSDEIDARTTHDAVACSSADYIGAPKAAKLLGCAPSTITRQCDSGKYSGALKQSVDGKEVWQIPITSLPKPAQKKLAAEVKAAMLERVAQTTPLLPAPNDVQRESAEYRFMWDAYEKSGEVNKSRAEKAHAALWAYHECIDSGMKIGEAEKAVAASHGVSKTTLWRYLTNTKSHPKSHWLPLLSPKYKGGRPPAEFTPAAYDFILAKYMTTTKIQLTVVLVQAREQAKIKGWKIPSYDAVVARLAKEPAWLETVGRTGPKALERSYPAVDRDYASLALHEYWESDGCKSDVFCIWPDGSIARPFVIVWREVRSRLVLGAKGYRNPTAEGVLAAFGMALERAQTAPAYAKLDNGREYAAKAVTGGQANRYRFKVMPGEQPGIMTQVGAQAVWAKPGRGQDKPIESFWNFIKEHCDKTFQGAYCGKDTVSKPEDFDKTKAVPIAIYANKLAAVLEYFNTQHRHTDSGMNGRTPMEAYTELSANTVAKPVDPAHIRMCKMPEFAGQYHKVM